MSRFERSHRGRHGDGVATIVGVGVAEGMEDFDGAILRSGDAAQTMAARLP